MTERKLKSIVQIITAAAVSFLFFMLLAITMQYVKLGELNSSEASLENELNALLVERTELTDDLSYIQTQEYVEIYAREILGWGKII